MAYNLGYNCLFLGVVTNNKFLLERAVMLALIIYVFGAIV